MYVVGTRSLALLEREEPTAPAASPGSPRTSPIPVQTFAFGTTRLCVYEPLVNVKGCR